MKRDIINLYALKTYGEVGPRTLFSLLFRYGNVGEVLKASSEDLIEIRGISDKKARKIVEAQHNLESAETDLKLIKDAGIKYVSILDKNYPERLKRISDPALILFYRGKFPPAEMQAIAVVGTTKATEPGIAAAVQISKMLSKNKISVISGMAAGIDASAHLGTLKENGYTVGVLGSGLLHIYPEENKALSKMVEKSGCLMSEYHPDNRVSKGRLISRNRIVVGLSSAVIVVEMSEDSTGTLDAINRAGQQGKSCYLFDPLKKIPLEKQSEFGLVCFESVDQLESMLEFILIDNEQEI
ncbi:MAG: hypothetical protein GY855_05615 [candidate division Zixibacteria bacterium]|nr:hypothetical protein [candidate division Zixibacteria bacterium]